MTAGVAPIPVALGIRPEIAVAAIPDDEAERMMARVRDERITVFFVRIPVEFGTIEP